MNNPRGDNSIYRRVCLNSDYNKTMNGKRKRSSLIYDKKKNCIDWDFNNKLISGVN